MYVYTCTRVYLYVIVIVYVYVRVYVYVYLHVYVYAYVDACVYHEELSVHLSTLRHTRIGCAVSLRYGAASSCAKRDLHPHTQRCGKKSLSTYTKIQRPLSAYAKIRSNLLACGT